MIYYKWAPTSYKWGEIPLSVGLQPHLPIHKAICGGPINPMYETKIVSPPLQTGNRG